MMDTRSLIHAEIDQLTDEQLVELARWIREIKGEPGVEKPNGLLIHRFEREPGVEQKQSLMSRLREIKIDAPANFSEMVLRARHGDFGGE